MSALPTNTTQEKAARILIVDDEPKNIAILVKLLQENGYQVRAAREAESALKCLEIDPVDLILLDIRMPGKSGFEVCEYLKQDERTADIPVIFLSALDGIENKVKGLELGAVDYVTKPFNLDEVLARVVRQLKLRSEYKARLSSWPAQTKFSPAGDKKDRGHGAYRKSGLDSEKRREICRRLTAYFEKEKPYLSSELNISTITGKLKVSRHNLSEAVNVELQQNISHFINKYRIDYFCRLLKEQPQTSILELAFQSGFNSKSVFNHWFKIIKKTTPKKFSP